MAYVYQLGPADQMKDAAPERLLLERFIEEEDVQLTPEALLNVTQSCDVMFQLIQYQGLSNLAFQLLVKSRLSSLVKSCLILMS